MTDVDPQTKHTKALVIATLLGTGNQLVNEDRLVWAALVADDVLRLAGLLPPLPAYDDEDELHLTAVDGG